MVNWIKAHPRLVGFIALNELRGVIMTAPAWWALLHHWGVV
jgi:hypothetical protein